MTIKSIILSILVLSYLVPFSLYYLNRLRGKQSNARFAFLTNAVVFFGTLLIANILLFRGQVYASSLDPEVVATTQTALSNVDSWRYIAAALSTGLSCIGAGIAVASAASAALGALSENQGIMGKALIFVALAESIALYGLLISFSLLSA